MNVYAHLKSTVHQSGYLLALFFEIKKSATVEQHSKLVNLI